MRGIAVGLLGLWLSFGCTRREAIILGQVPQGAPQSISSLKAVSTHSPVVLDGIMIEKCPVAGCWFRLRDTTGVIKVDTRAAGFVVAKVPVNSKVVVSGKLVTEGDDVAIEALGVRY